jgi:hypothetical protein
MIRLFTALAACALVGVACLGCSKGPELGSVSGVVTMDGQPLPNAVVTFVPVAGGRAAAGQTDANGQYTLVFVGTTGALVGQHRVSVTTAPKAQGSAPSGKMTEEEYQKQAAGGTDPSAYDKAQVVEPIPERYNTKTELVKEVKAGQNTINLELASK